MFKELTWTTWNYNFSYHSTDDWLKGNDKVLVILIHSKIVVFFDQHLGAVHSKCWSKYAFFKSKKIVAKVSRKCIFEFAPKPWWRVLILDKPVIIGKNMFTDRKGIFSLNFLSFSLFLIFLCETHKKTIFQPVFGGRRSQMLVNI